MLPNFLIRFTLWILTHTVFRIKIAGPEYVYSRGPALLVCNHISFIDALLVAACIRQAVRFVIFKSYYEMPVLHRLFQSMKAIPIIIVEKPNCGLEFIDRAREELRQGQLVCIFAEGAITRTGNPLPFKKVFERIIDGL